MDRYEKRPTNFTTIPLDYNYRFNGKLKYQSIYIPFYAYIPGSLLFLWSLAYKRYKTIDKFNNLRLTQSFLAQNSKENEVN